MYLWPEMLNKNVRYKINGEPNLLKTA